MSDQLHYPAQPQVPAGMPVGPPARNGLGLAALILGVIGAISGIIPFLFWMAGVLGLIALVLGLGGRGRAKRGQATNKGVATTGAALGAVSMVLAVIGLVITVSALGDVVNEIEKVTDKTSASAPAKAEEGAKNEDAAKESEPGDTSAKTLTASDAVVYDDGVKITVSDPAAYQPGEFAIGHTKGNDAYSVTIKIENTGKESFDTALVSVDARAGQDGKTAEQIYDGESEFGFTGSLLPGKSASVEFAFDAPADAGNLDIEVAPSWDYDSTHWSLEL